LRASCACYHRARSVKSCALEEDSPSIYRLTIASVLQRDANRWTQHRRGFLSFRKFYHSEIVQPATVFDDFGGKWAG
jgi:hypothetical protein